MKVLSITEPLVIFADLLGLHESAFSPPPLRLNPDHVTDFIYEPFLLRPGRFKNMDRVRKLPRKVKLQILFGRILKKKKKEKNILTIPKIFGNSIAAFWVPDQWN